MSFGEISIPAVFSRFSASSNNSNTQFEVCKTESSSAQIGESTKLGMSNKLRCSVWGIAEFCDFLGECSQACT